MQQRTGEALGVALPQHRVCAGVRRLRHSASLWLTSNDSAARGVPVRNDATTGYHQANRTARQQKLVSSS